MGRKPSTGLTWRESEGRWRKKYRGRYFYFSAGQGNKIKSESAAKEAYRQWKLAIDVEDNKKQKRLSPALLAIQEMQQELTATYCDSPMVRAAYAALQALAEKTTALSNAWTTLGAQQDNSDMVDVFAMEQAKSLMRNMLESETKKSSVGTRVDLLEVKFEVKAPKRPHGIAPWETIEDNENAPPTLSKLITAFLVDQQQQVALKEISAGRYDKLRVVTGKIADFLGKHLPVTELGNQQLLAWQAEVKQRVVTKQMATVTARDTLAVTKRLIRWAYHRGFIENLPRCIAATGKDAFTVSMKTSEIVPAKTTDFQKLLNAATKDKEKLVLFLGINCGYGPRDIAGIRKKEIDWKASTISRCRTKTSNHRNSPVVTYKLWPETLLAIKANLSNDAELAFVTEKGNPLVNESIGSDGIVKRHDAVHSIWFRLSKKAKSKTQLKQLRKLGATLLKQRYPQFVDRYLGHVASKISDRHYALEYQQGFDEALKWLREQVVPQPKKTGSKASSRQREV